MRRTTLSTRSGSSVPNNVLTLAVAGSRKTQGIVDACAAADSRERILILTYTTANQNELRKRLAHYAGNKPLIEVAGWFSFIIRNFAQPFVPFLYPGRRVQGFDFASPPQQGVHVGQYRRYFNQHGEVRKVHLPHLAVLIEGASRNAGIRRLGRLYDRIFIDEVQDLCGYDLEVLKLLMASSLHIEMVGDVRQAILATNDRERKNSPYKYMGIWRWFKEREAGNQLEINQRCSTWRCHPAIAKFADSLFGSEWGFDTSISLNTTTTPHDGIFLVRPEHVSAYTSKFNPLSLRNSENSGKSFAESLAFMNIRVAKGLSAERVLIHATGPMTDFLLKDKTLTSPQAARLYVAVTRAEQSAAFIIEKPRASRYPYWQPEDVPDLDSPETSTGRSQTGGM